MKKYILLAVLVLSIVLAVWFSVAGRALMEWKGLRDVCEPPFVVLNPFRDRDPERSADQFLTRIQGGDFAQLARAVQDDDKREMIRSLESERKIKSWFAAGGSDAGDEVSIQYWLTRPYENGCQTVPARVNLIKVDNRWVVIGYNPAY
ncbi:MAG TPA: hypothetical protein VJV05_08035 [Pyrinomonadaceae bacterium]|nr:hypothetical protein [Pyrinomonadaceae bacterium]